MVEGPDTRWPGGLVPKEMGTDSRAAKTYGRQRAEEDRLMWRRERWMGIGSFLVLWIVCTLLSRSLIRSSVLYVVI